MLDNDIWGSLPRTTTIEGTSTPAPVVAPDLYKSPVYPVLYPLVLYAALGLLNDSR